jgi:hypothetical protein
MQELKRQGKLKKKEANQKNNNSQQLKRKRDEDRDGEDAEPPSKLPKVEVLPLFSILRFYS